MRLFLTAEIGTEVDFEKVASSLEKSLAEITANKVFEAALVAVVSLVIVKVLLAVLDRALHRSKMDDALKRLLHGLFKGAMLFVAVIVVLGCLGLEVTSLVAVLSVIGLAFSLALQNFLANVAGGMQLLASHPFKVGDFVEAGGCSGFVTDVDMFYTRLATYDNKVVQIPNSSIVSANIINYTARPTRRVDVAVFAGYDTPVDKVLEALTELGRGHELVLGDPAPAAHVTSYDEKGVHYALRVWCTTADYWPVYLGLIDHCKAAFDAAGIEMAYPHVNVHMAEK